MISIFLNLPRLAFWPCSSHLSPLQKKKKKPTLAFLCNTQKAPLSLIGVCVCVVVCVCNSLIWGDASPHSLSLTPIPTPLSCRASEEGSQV